MEIVTRAQWGARYGRGNALTGIVGHVVIHHTAGAVFYQDADAEAREVASIERFHANGRGWAGIGYSFLVAPSGRAYEGRGWGRVGAHTEGHNSSAYGICVMGNGEIEPATPQAIAAIRGLIESGIRNGRLIPSPRVTGHRDHAPTACPGSRTYRLLDLLDGITGTGAELEEDDMTEEQLERVVRRVVREELNQGTAPGQRSWASTSVATLDTAQRTYNLAISNGAQTAAVGERLERIEAELTAAREALTPPASDAVRTQVFDPPKRQ